MKNLIAALRAASPATANQTTPTGPSGPGAIPAPWTNQAPGSFAMPNRPFANLPAWRQEMQQKHKMPAPPTPVAAQSNLPDWFTNWSGNP